MALISIMRCGREHATRRGAWVSDLGRLLIFSLAALLFGAAGKDSMVSAANSTNGVRLYTQVQMIKGVQYLRAAPVVEKSQTHYVLVARSEKQRFVEKFIEAKRSEWQTYIACVHPWEVERYLQAY